MIGIEKDLLRLVAELPTSVFKKACKEAGLDKVAIELILENLPKEGE